MRRAYWCVHSKMFTNTAPGSHSQTLTLLVGHEQQTPVKTIISCIYSKQNSTRVLSSFTSHLWKELDRLHYQSMKLTDKIKLRTGPTLNPPIIANYLINKNTKLLHNIERLPTVASTNFTQNCHFNTKHHIANNCNVTFMVKCTCQWEL